MPNPALEQARHHQEASRAAIADLHATVLRKRKELAELERDLRRLTDEVPELTEAQATALAEGRPLGTKGPGFLR